MERVLVLGATSAIAQEVCALHAARGDQLFVIGRDEDKLAALIERTGARGRSADLAELDRNEALVNEAITALGGVDRVLIAHGFLGDQQKSEHDLQHALEIINVNFTSVVSLLVPLANAMTRDRAGGRIGVITSVAGDRGRPRNYTYGAAKGALNVYLQGLRTRLYADDVSVTTLKLGPVDTPMTVEHRKHALFGKTPAVARGIARAMDARRAEVYVPGVWRMIMPIVRSTPEVLFQKLPFLAGR